MLHGSGEDDWLDDLFKSIACHLESEGVWE